MAMSSCVKCGKNLFELHEGAPHNSNYKYFYLQCTACGGVAGLTDFYNVASIVSRLEDQVKDLSRVVASIDHNLDILASRGP